MKTLKSYPGVLTILLIALALSINAVVDYIDYEIAGPSFLAALGLLMSALVLIGVYEFKDFRKSRLLKREKV